MRPDCRVDLARARAQWHALREEVERHARVSVVPAPADLPDFCFSANAGLVRSNRFVPSQFKYPQRQGEAAIFADHMRQAAYRISALQDGIIFEVAGDALFDWHHRLWMGYGPRSQLAAAAQLSALLDVEVIPLKLADPRFYHLDTCFCPLDSGHIVFFPGAFTESGRAALRRLIPQHRRIEVDEADACRFACNMISLNGTIIAHAVSTDLRRKLEDSGHEVRCVDLSEFQKSGGSAKCLSLRIG